MGEVSGQRVRRLVMSTPIGRSCWHLDRGHLERQEPAVEAIPERSGGLVAFVRTRFAINESALRDR